MANENDRTDWLETNLIEILLELDVFLEDFAFEMRERLFVGGGRCSGRNRSSSSGSHGGTSAGLLNDVLSSD